MDFDTWLEQIDTLFEEYGFSRGDFDDWNWKDAFDVGDSPKQAFENWDEEDNASALI